MTSSCSECSQKNKYTYVAQIHMLPSQEETYEKSVSQSALLTPREIVEFLDKYVVGQEEAKRTLAVAIFSHYKRINSTNSELALPKNNILIQGPTGSGKTFLLQNLAKLLDVPFCVIDATNLTEKGFKGEDLDSELSRLVQTADGDVGKAEKGIVYIDEFDKLSNKFGWTARNGTTNGSNVQRQILRVLEGAEIGIKGMNALTTNKSRMSTENILFVCGGAFVGLGEYESSDDTLYKRVIGFSSQYEEDNNQKGKRRITSQDFIDYGFIPEVMGRLPNIVSLKELGEKDLVKILMETEGSLIKRYQNLLKGYGAELIIEEDAIEEIAHQAFLKKTGARGLNAVVEQFMGDILYEVPSDPTIVRCIVSKDVVEGKTKACYEYEYETASR